MSSESRRIHRGMIEPAFPPTQSVVPPIPRRGMTRRAFCAGAAFLAAAGTLSLAGCNSLPFTGAAPVRLVIKVPRTGHDVVFDDSISQVETVIQGMAEGFQRDYERPVDVEVVVFEQNQYDEAVKGSFDTDKAPDVLYGDYFNISTYIRTGRVVPLDDVVAPAIRDDLFDDLWNMGVVEGRAYMMPYLARQNVLAYNKEMFRNAGLGEFVAEGKITAWSLDEWTRILDALAASLPKGSFPMMMYAGSPKLWCGIAFDNACALKSGLDEMASILGSFAAALETGDRETFTRLLAEAADARRALPAAWVPSTEKLLEVRIPMVNRTGVVAEVCTIASSVGCNIQSIDIDHISEGNAVLSLILTDEGDIGQLSMQLINAGFSVSFSPLMPKEYAHIE